MAFCVQVLQHTQELPPEQREPRKKDGALNVIGQVAEVLMKVHYSYSSHSPRDGFSVAGAVYSVAVLMFILAVLVENRHIGVFEPNIVLWFHLYLDMFVFSLIYRRRPTRLSWSQCS